MRTPTPSRWRLVAARLRMPLMAITVVAFFGGLVVGLSGPPMWAAIVLLVVAFALYFRLATPAGATVDLTSPVAGRWQALNSPTSHVPSHALHGWAQTYAVDLVFDPADGSRPAFAPLPIARRPEDFPGFGQPVHSPLAGEVVRARSGWRDHWSRTSPLALAYLLLESVRELVGPSGILGNHLVIRADDGACVALAHLRRRSLRVGVGDRVDAGQPVAECGNSGNSSEPHLHIQAMDLPSTWIASARPLTFDGQRPPANKAFLEPAASSATG